jgi:hypothetical protein
MPRNNSNHQFFARRRPHSIRFFNSSAWTVRFLIGVMLVDCAILDANLLPLSARRGLRDGIRGKIMRGRGAERHATFIV